MKCPNVKKCKGDLVIRTDDDGTVWWYCPTCGWKNIKEKGMHSE